MEGQNMFCSYPSSFDTYSDGSHIKRGEPMREMDIDTLCKLYLRSKPTARIPPNKQDPVSETRSEEYNQMPQYSCRTGGPFNRLGINQQHSVNHMYNGMRQYNNNYSMAYPQAFNVSYPNVPSMQYDNRAAPFSHQGYANGPLPFIDNTQKVCYCSPYQRNSSSYQPYFAAPGKENIFPNGMPSGGAKIEQPCDKEPSGVAKMEKLHNKVPSSAAKMKQPHNKASKPVKSRTVFTGIQLLALENKFQEKQYLTRIDRASLAVDLCMSEKQVKTWFQNRRTKQKDTQNSLLLY